MQKNRKNPIFIRRRRPDPEEAPLSFREAAEGYLASLRPRLKESTVNKYSNLLGAYALPALGALPVEQVDAARAEALCAQLLHSGGSGGTGLSPKTVAGVLSVVRGVLRWAGGDPARLKGLRRPGAPGRAREPRLLCRREQERLCAWLFAHPEPVNAGILLCLFTGLRLGELCALRWEDLSLEEATLQVRHTLQRLQDKSGTGPRTRIVVTAPKSPCSVRRIPIPQAVNELLRGLRRDSGYLLTGCEACMEPRTMQNRFKRVLKAAGLEDLNFHALRHSFATRCVELGFDIKSLSEILGHSSVGITMDRYVHPSLDMKRDNMRLLDKLLEPPSRRPE